jgi:hypothetical protein
MTAKNRYRSAKGLKVRFHMVQRLALEAGVGLETMLAVLHGEDHTINYVRVRAFEYLRDHGLAGLIGPRQP